MKEWFFQLTRKKQIVLCVIGAHLFCLLFLTIDSFVYRHSNKRQKVVVHTVHITPPQKQIAQKTTSAPKKKESKAPAPKKPAAKPKKTPVVSEPNPSNAKLLKEIEESFEAIASLSNVKVPQTTIHIPTLSTPTSQVSNELSSEEIIATFLREVLTLPEMGEVKAILSIDREGHLQSIDILVAKSEKNAAFLKNRLPQLQFPCLNEEASMTVLFSNEL